MCVENITSPCGCRDCYVL